MNYTGLIPILIKATQELNEKLELLQNENKQIKQELARLKNNSINNEFTSSLLLQNAPNPVQGKTIIGYVLTASYSKAQITIADSKGSVVKQLTLTGNGNGNIQYDASVLSTGNYVYSLVIDGKMCASKQMIIAK